MGSFQLFANCFWQYTFPSMYTFLDLESNMYICSLTLSDFDQIQRVYRYACECLQTSTHHMRKFESIQSYNTSSSISLSFSWHDLKNNFCLMKVIAGIKIYMCISAAQLYSERQYLQQHTICCPLRIVFLAITFNVNLAIFYMTMLHICTLQLCQHLLTPKTSSSTSVTPSVPLLWTARCLAATGGVNLSSPHGSPYGASLQLREVHTADCRDGGVSSLSTISFIVVRRDIFSRRLAV